MEPSHSNANESDFEVLSPLSDSWTRDKAFSWKRYDPEAYKARKKEIEERKLDEKVKAVTSSVTKKEIRDRKNIYLVLTTEENVRASRLYEALQKLSATVHANLDVTNRTLLVSTSEDILMKYEKSGMPWVVKETLVDFRELKLEEQISKNFLEDSDWTKSPKPAILHIVPNIDTNLAEDYLNKLARFIEEKKCVVTWKAPADLGMMIAKIDRGIAEDLLKKSNLIFKIHELPRGIPAKGMRQRSKYSRVKGEASSLTSDVAVPTGNLPIVCVADTGVKI